MAEPSEKSPAIEQLLETLTGRTTAIESNVCATCGRSAASFRDTLSEREYTISGVCQACQDTVFEEEEEYD